MYLRSPLLDPVSNIRLETRLFRTVRTGLVRMLWRNSDCVVLGRNQDAAAETDLRFAAEHGISVLRRASGGGAVYHDPGTVNFTFLSDLPEDGSFSLRELTSPAVSALHEMGIPVSFSGRNDLLLPDGRKICGTAARIHEGRVLCHGCICFDTDLSRMERVLTPSAEKLGRHGVRSVRSRVACLRELMPEMTAEDFLLQLETELLRGMDVIPYPDALLPDGTAPDEEAWPELIL